MRIPILVRLGGAAVLAAVIAFATAAPAGADTGTTIRIDRAALGKTASQFPVHRCDPRLGGGPFRGEDVWVFALPRPKEQGDFTSLTIRFATEGGPVTETITTSPARDRAIVDGKAWIRTSAGLAPDGRLLDQHSIIEATATITGGGDGVFELRQTCPATGGLGPSALPVTGPGFAGLSLGTVTAIGAGLLLVGLVLVGAQRRRRAEA